MTSKSEGGHSSRIVGGWGSIERDRVEIVMMNNMLELKIILHDL